MGDTRADRRAQAPDAATAPAASPDALAVREADVPTRLGRLCARLDARAATRGGYALVFLAFFLLGWLPVILTALGSGKSLLWQTDGTSQQLVWYIYVGQWIREVFSSIFVDHQLEIPLWSSSFGYGADVIQTIGGMFVNPLYWTSALLPESLAEFGLEAVSLATLYLAGLAFSLWASSRGLGRRSCLVGALVYVFSGFTVVTFTQPSFLTMLVVLPLALLTVDRVFARRSPVPFVLVLAWTLAWSYYDAYMLLLILVGYCLLSFFFVADAGLPRKGRAVRLLKWTGSFVWYVLLALLLSCLLLLPQVMAILGSSRMSVDYGSEALYGLWYYVNMFSRALSVMDMGNDDFVGLNAVAPVALLLLCMRRRRHRALFIAFVATSLMLLLPIAGQVMNGMSYPANRWSWAYSLVVAYVVARLLPEVVAMGARERRVCATILVAYCALTLVFPLVDRSAVVLPALIVAVGALAVLLSARHWPVDRLFGTLACTAAISGAVVMSCYLSPYFNGFATELAGVGRSWQFLSSSSVATLAEQADESGEGYDESYRYDIANFSTGAHNSGLVTSLMSPDYYCSVYSQGIDDLNTSLGLVDNCGMNFKYGSLNSRSMLEGLFGVRYFCLNSKNSDMLPETFADGEVIAEGEGTNDHFELWQTDVVAPLAFVTSNYLTRSAYEALPMEDRQAALLSGVVLEDDDEVEGLTDVSDAPSSLPETQDVPYEVVSATGCEWSDGEIVVRKANAQVTLSIASPVDAETYVMVSDFAYEDISLREQYTDEEWESLGLIKRLKERVAMLTDRPDNVGDVTIRTDGNVQSKICQFNSSSHLYGGKHDWMASAGYHADSLTTITLTFSTPGVYSFSSLRVIAQPMEGVDEAILSLAEAGADDITLGTNEMSATCSSDEGGLLFWSVAYSEGWSATVDGEPAEVHQADLGMMAVEVPAGEHEVRLSYRTPYLDLGAVLTLVGAGATVATCLVRRHRRAREVGRPLPDAVSSA